MSSSVTVDLEPPENGADVGELRAAVRRFIGSRVADAATCDDLTQDVLVKVQKRVMQLRDPRRLMGWVIQIARNTVADYFRRSRATESFTEEHLSGTPALPESFQHEEQKLRETLAAYIRSVVHELPVIYRDALLWTEYEGIAQVELARRLGLSVSAVKSRVQRARAMVRETIDRCCHFEVDRYGTIVNWTPRQTASECKPDSEKSAGCSC